MRFLALALPAALTLGALAALDEADPGGGRRGRGAADAGTPPPRGAVAAGGEAEAGRGGVDSAAGAASVWEVVVVDGEGRPIRRAPVRGTSGRVAMTDALGRVVLAGPPDARELPVEVMGGDFVLSESPEILRFERTMPVEVELIDATTGAALPAAWAVARGPSHVWRGGWSSLEVAVAPPEGAGYQAPFVHDAGTSTAAGAHGLRAVVPVRGEKVLELRILDAQGAPVRGAAVETVLLGGEAPRFTVAEEPEVEWEEKTGRLVTFRPAEAGADGRIRLRGVPYLQGETVHVVVASEERRAAASLRLDERLPFAVVSLPDDPRFAASGWFPCQGFG